MTALLLEKGAVVKSFEIDPGFAFILNDLFAGNSFTLIPGDVMKTWEQHNDQSPCLLGNLPYTIAAVLMGDLIEKGRFFRRMVITVQKEVARRMSAGPGSKDYSSISVLCASAYTIRPLLELKAASFYPPPRVDSTALLFERKAAAAGIPAAAGTAAGTPATDGTPGNAAGAADDSAERPKIFAALVRSLFSSRRKTVSNNLEHFLSSSCILKAGSGKEASRQAAVFALEQCGIQPNERAEKLSLEEFTALAAFLPSVAGWAAVQPELRKENDDSREYK
jgi:16S rRNA (adenine1518-N6/adenine1519-N6)-dimethyltransferase